MKIKSKKETNTTRKKINWLLILQGWAMLWVVIGHSPLGEPGVGPAWETALYHFAYSFHMPLFMLVSGWLFYLTRLKDNTSIWGGQKWNYMQIVKDKSLRLLLPGFVFSVVAFFLKIAFSEEMTRQVGVNIHDIMHAYLYPYDNPLRELWFIITLFWFMILAPLWKVVIKKGWSSCAMLGLLIVINLITPDIELLCIGRVLSFAIWFYFGMLIAKKEIVENLFEKNNGIVLGMGIIIYIVGRFSHSFITTAGGITLSLGLVLLADKFVPRLFFTFRNYTYQIFLMGIFAQIAVKIIYRHTEYPYLPSYLLCVAAGLYVPVLISKTLEWINLYPLLLCSGLKEKK